MIYRYLLFISCLLFVTPAAWAQRANTGPPQSEEQNETMLDTLKRMQIKREEDEHKKLLEKGAQVKEDAEALSKEFSKSGGNRLPRSAEKKLREIEKSARHIRSEWGGSENAPLDPLPANLVDALKQLSEASERLNTDLDKTSRRVVSVSVVGDATEIIQLVKLLRGYLY